MLMRGFPWGARIGVLPHHTLWGAELSCQLRTGETETSLMNFSALYLHAALKSRV